MKAAAVALLVAGLLAGCGTSGTAAPSGSSTGQPAAQASPIQSAEIQRLLDAARNDHETELGISWAESSLGGSVGAKAFEGVFNNLYGTNIKINFTPGPSIPDVTGKVTQELAAGQKSSTDVLITADTTLAPVLDRDLLEPYDYTQLSPRITSKFLAPKNLSVEVVSLVPGITYNTNLVQPADVPKKMEDVLNPKWKGKIATTPYVTGFDRIALRPEWTPQKVKDYMAKLTTNLGGLIRSGEEPRIATGEFAMMVLDTGFHQAQKQIVKGAPLQQVIPQDAGTVGFLYLGVPRNSAHPNLAKLYINALMTEQGQAALYTVAFLDHYELAGSRLAAELKQRGVDPSTFLRTDVAFVAAHPELSQLQLELQKMVTEQK